MSAMVEPDPQKVDKVLTCTTSNLSAADHRGGDAASCDLTKVHAKACTTVLGCSWREQALRHVSVAIVTFILAFLFSPLI